VRSALRPPGRQSAGAGCAGWSVGGLRIAGPRAAGHITGRSGRPPRPAHGCDGTALWRALAVFGTAPYNLDFDASGRLVRNEQVLTQQRFENLPIGIWTRADLQNTFGMPLRIEQVARFDGDIWTYRFRQNSDLRQAHVHLDRQGVVRQVLFTDELPNFDNARD